MGSKIDKKEVIKFIKNSKDESEKYEYLADLIYIIFEENDLYMETYTVSDIDGNKAAAFFIDWGDWKHDHIYADYLIEECCLSNGIDIEIITDVTEEDGSDCYCAEHYVIIL